MGTNQRAQIVMSTEEVQQFVATSRTATLATHGPHETIHLVAMWYAVTDGEIWFETKAKSQKAVNLRRDARCSVSIEAGYTYDQLRGVAIEGTAEITDDPDHRLAVGISVWERYNGPYSEELRPAVDEMMRNRVAVRLVADRTRSWDHRKLGLPQMPVAGSTATFLND
ncbi:pyridoxamine 5'-phosphate oxidase family protein [Williamsia sterculiae]|uniref:PPOX class probable F420-dependent enzyme n=1 Tax=Williamsia sterculiae TaxID=1344003 RepID=A0A1N7G4J9_9NOCA|nr:PPOX class F420-dependent oxidoreductase [Williamsia sterculiae]SIS07519.1 PPOX class probable F420-dependent enzyme [Williamsia sterculiae]